MVVLAPRFRKLRQEKQNAGLASIKNGADSGYFADPARIKESIKLVDNKIPSFWTLLTKRKFGDMAWFFPEFFWRTRHLIILFVFINSFRKFGKKFTLKMLFEYLQWKISGFFFNLNKSIYEKIYFSAKNSPRKYRSKNYDRQSRYDKITSREMIKTNLSHKHFFTTSQNIS